VWRFLLEIEGALAEARTIEDVEVVEQDLDIRLGRFSGTGLFFVYDG
jgi:hypothetical protein